MRNVFHGGEGYTASLLRRPRLEMKAGF